MACANAKRIKQTSKVKPKAIPTSMELKKNMLEKWIPKTCKFIKKVIPKEM